MEKNKNMKKDEDTCISTELFTGKTVPDFINNEPLFSTTPVKIKKVFPSIGLSNFKEKSKIEKVFVDFKKENSFIIPVMRDINKNLTDAVNSIAFHLEEWQFLASAEEKEKTRAAKTKLHSYSLVMLAVANQCNVSVQQVLDKAISLKDGKVNIRLFEDVIVPEYDKKAAFRKDQPLFKVYVAIKSELEEHGINIPALDNMQSFKTFSQENITSKEYNVVFSSHGKTGAWDLLTMSMRGIKSCQRWDGEYKHMLIGSILSKYIGILYITSGANIEGYGSKMMKRCLVRYVVNIETNKPALILDKMYPDYDQDVMNSFLSILKEKSGLDVFYGPTLLSERSLSKFYVPYEKTREIISEKLWSYQDTPLKTSIDVELSRMQFSSMSFEREERALYTNFSLHLARKLDDLLNYGTEYRNLISNINTQISLYDFCIMISETIRTGNNVKLVDEDFQSSKKLGRKYLIKMLVNAKKIVKSTAPKINQEFYNNSISATGTEIESFIDLVSNEFRVFLKESIPVMLK